MGLLDELEGNVVKATPDINPPKPDGEVKILRVAPAPEQTAEQTAEQPGEEELANLSASTKPGRKPGTKNKAKLVVMYDCMPTRGKLGSVTNLSDVLTPVVEAVAARQGVAHWSLIDYGQGAGYLAQAFGAYLAENPLSGVVLASRFSPETKAVQDVLERHADVVVSRLG